MGIFEHFPYTNFHNLNLDTILERTKEAITDAAEALTAANSAAEDAAEALSAANTAASNAATALTAANSAAEDAAEALGTANTAATNAATALTTANSAAEDATEALSAANSAAEDAAEALSTANAAKLHYYQISVRNDNSVEFSVSPVLSTLYEYFKNGVAAFSIQDTALSAVQLFKVIPSPIYSSGGDNPTFSGQLEYFGWRWDQLCFANIPFTFSKSGDNYTFNFDARTARLIATTAGTPSDPGNDV